MKPTVDAHDNACHPFPVPSPWSEIEVRLTVQDYFDMLLLELRGEPFNKAEHNRRLAQHLDARSKSSIEFKHENISAILLEMELPYIDGYKPASNYQGLLRDVVEEYAKQYQPEIERLTDIPEVHLPAVKWDSVLVEPPDIVAPSRIRPSAARMPRKFNLPDREACNPQLGHNGEEFVIEFEVRRFEQTGRKDLAKKVEWISEKDDTAGFDILSFDGDKERYIEVKTTNCARSFPFLISSNEVEFSVQHAPSYSLYRVFTFRTAPRLFMLPGDVRKHCSLEPKVYRASVGRPEST